MANVYEVIPVPGFSSGDTYVDDEILYSTIGYTQKGVTLAGGQGEILAGTLLACNANDLKYYPVSSTVDGIDLGPAEGVLRHSVNLGGAGADDQQQDLVVAGILKLEKIHDYTGTELTQLGAVVSERRGTFKF